MPTNIPAPSLHGLRGPDHGPHDLPVSGVMNEFDGRRAVVTGGTRGGIGAAITARLTEAGARVLTTARSTPDDLADAELFVAADVGTAEGIALVADAAMRSLGGVDIVVHVVGGSRQEPGGVLALSDDDWEQAFAVNLFASVRLDRALLPSMIDQGRCPTRRPRPP
jgi:NAD(P)-dependent dehydrogenase (short-subunit alcohol dehydrogenase family)